MGMPLVWHRKLHRKQCTASSLFLVTGTPHAAIYINEGDTGNLEKQPYRRQVARNNDHFRGALHDTGRKHSLLHRRQCARHVEMRQQNSVKNHSEHKRSNIGEARFAPHRLATACQLMLVARMRLAQALAVLQLVGSIFTAKYSRTLDVMPGQEHI